MTLKERVGDQAPTTLIVHLDLGNGRSVPAARLDCHEAAPGSKPVWTLTYGERYRSRADALPIDPLNLPLTDRPATKAGWVFGALKDALPDRWGTRLFDAWFAQKIRDANLPARQPTVMDRLLHVKDDRVGALSFSLSPSQAPHQHAMDERRDLPWRVRAMEDLEQGAPLTAQELAELGTGSGGARPKTTFREQGAYWLAKFGVSADAGLDIPGWEAGAMNLLAMLPQVRVAGVRLGDVAGRRTLFVRRFDREDIVRRHYLSAGTLLGCEVTDSHGSYPELALALRNIGAPITDRVELYRRMVFNAMIGNRDDHPWNHGVIWTGTGWRLAPAFDVLPHPAMPAVQAMAMGRLGGIPSLDNLLSSPAPFGLDPAEAKEIVAQTACTILACWRPMFEYVGVPEHQIHDLTASFDLARQAQASLGITMETAPTPTLGLEPGPR